MANRTHGLLVVATAIALVGMAGCQVLAGLVDMALVDSGDGGDVATADAASVANDGSRDETDSEAKSPSGDAAAAVDATKAPALDSSTPDPSIVDSGAVDSATADHSVGDAGATHTFADNFDSLPGLGPGWTRNVQPTGNSVGVETSVTDSPPNALLSTINAFNGSAVVSTPFAAALGATVHTTFKLQMALDGNTSVAAQMFVATIGTGTYDRLQIWREGTTASAALCVGTTACVTTDVALPDGPSWISVDMTIHFATNATGWYTVRINGTLWATQSQIVTASTAPGSTSVQLGLWSNGGYPPGAHAYYDDVAIDVSP